MPRKWTEEQKKEQSLKMQGWKPWVNSTGPKTIEGKAASCSNAFKGGLPRKRAIENIVRNCGINRNQIPQEMIDATILERKVRKLIKELKK